MYKLSKLFIISLLFFSLVGCKKSEGEKMGERIQEHADDMYKDKDFVEYACKDWIIRVTISSKKAKNISIERHNNDVVDYRINYPVDKDTIGKGKLEQGNVDEEKVLDNVLKYLGTSTDIFVEYSEWYYLNEGIGWGKIVDDGSKEQAIREEEARKQKQMQNE